MASFLSVVCSYSILLGGQAVVDREKHLARRAQIVELTAGGTVRTMLDNTAAGTSTDRSRSTRSRGKFLYPSPGHGMLPLGVLLEYESDTCAIHASGGMSETEAAVMVSFKLAAIAMSELKTVIGTVLPNIAPEANRYFTAATLGLTTISNSMTNLTSDDPSKQAAGAASLFNGLVSSVDAALTAQQKATNGYLTYHNVVGNVSSALNGIGGIVQEYQQGMQATDACWKDSQARGVGALPKTCSGEASEYDAGLCYKPCPSGYNGIGPVCWRTSYGRGVGRLPNSVDDSNNGCGADLEAWAGLCYQICPDGWTGAGTLCYHSSAEVASYGRAAGRVPGCAQGFSMSAGLCYQDCKAGFVGKVTRCVKSTGAPLTKYRGHEATPLPCKQGQVQHGALCYPVCEEGYVERGCCICEAESYDRGLGKIPGDCGDDEVKDAGLCYTKCREHYKGVGPICWREVIDRGIGRIPTECPDGWEVSFGLCFEPCRDGFKGEGSLCHPFDIASEETQTISVERGVGVPPGCQSSQEYDASLCYQPCAEGFKGIGPVCWHECRDPLPADGGAMCCDSQSTCTRRGLEMAFGVVTGGVTAGVSFVAGQYGGGLNSLARIGTAFTMPKCDALHSKLEGGALLSELLWPVGMLAFSHHTAAVGLASFKRPGSAMRRSIGRARSRPRFMYAERMRGLLGPPVGILIEEDDDQPEEASDDSIDPNVEEGVLLGFKTASLAVAKVQSVIEELLPDIAPKASTYLQAAVNGLDSVSSSLPDLMSGDSSRQASGTETLWTGLMSTVDSALTDEQKQTKSYLTYHRVTGNISDAIQGLGGIVSSYEENLKSTNACWKDSQGRGAGRPPTKCGLDEAKTDYDSGLCYEPCPIGMHGVGPVCWRDSYSRGLGKLPSSNESSNFGCGNDMESFLGLCYQKCPDGWIGVSTACHPENAQEVSIGRGVGSPLRCAADMEISVGLCYPKCRNGFLGFMTQCKSGSTSEYRGLGVLPSECGADEDKQGALCYPKCKENYYGVGPVCWRIVKDRGVGRIPDMCSEGFEMSAGLCYEKCREGYISSGPLCHHSDMNGEMQTVSKSRGIGIPPTCEDGKEYDAGLCYTPCAVGFNGIGPVCWHVCDYPLLADGGAMCCDTPGTCMEKGLQQFMAVLTGGLSAGMAFKGGEYGSALNSLAKVGSPFALPQCSALHAQLG